MNSNPVIGRIASSFRLVEESGQVKQTKETHWSLQQRMTRQTSLNIHRSRAEENRRLTLETFNDVRREDAQGPAFAGKKIYLVAKLKNKKFWPVGVKTKEKQPPISFGSWETLLAFAKKLGRSKVRVGCIVRSVN